MIELLINDVEVKCSDGAPIKELATEELNSSTIIIPMSEKLKLNVLDKVTIIINDNKNLYFKYFVLSTFVENEQTFDDEKYYEYTLSLVSPTLLLERIQIPNRKFTPRNGRTCLWQANEILAYINEKYPSISFSSAFKAKYGAIEGVEKQLNKPNAKEALNAIVSIDNSIVTMTSFSFIDTIKLDKKGKAIDTSKLFTNENSQNANEYATSLKMTAQNCQSNEKNVFTETLGTRCMGESILTTNNLKYYTQHPIDEVVEAYLVFETGFDNKVVRGTLINNSNLNGSILIEKKEYDLKKVSTSNSPVYDLAYKRAHIYFERGKNVVDGLTYSENNFLNLSNNNGVAGFNILNIICTSAGEPFDSTTYDPFNIVLMITYKSLESVPLIVNKEGANDNVATLVDNQNENYVNLDDYAKSQQMKINRLGNQYKIITATYDNYSSIPTLFDYIDDYYLAEREYSVQDDFYLFKGVLYKNYIQQNLFYGVNSKRRTYAIATDDFVDREEIKEYTITVSKDLKTIDNNLLTNFVCYAFNSNNYNPTNNTTDTYILIKNAKLCYAVGRSQKDDGTYSSYFLLTPYLAKSGNSMTVNLKAYDNYAIGVYRTGEKKAGGWAQEYVSYVDENGECTKIEVTLFYASNFKPYSNITKLSEVKGFPNLTSKYEVYSSDYLGCETVFNINKDQQELLNLTIQVNFVSDDENIIITDKFVNYVTNTNGRSFLYVYNSFVDTYQKSDTKVKTSTTIITDGSVSIDYTTFLNYINLAQKMQSVSLYKNASVSFENWKSYCIADYNGNILIAVNRNTDGILPTTLYFNSK